MKNCDRVIFAIENEIGWLKYTKKIVFFKRTIFRRQFLLGYSYQKNCNVDKKIVKATKTDYFNRYG